MEPSTTTWIKPSEGEKLPEIGEVCSKCGQGEIKVSSYGGVYCGNCKWKWRVSKFEPETQKPTTGQTTSTVLLGEIRDILNAYEKYFLAWDKELKDRRNNG